jgi:serine/threonine-protein kinase RsbW
MATPLDEQTIEVKLDSKLGYERIAMACAGSFAQIIGFPTERIEDLKTVVGEAAINAMQHGNKWREDSKVTVQLNYKDNTINVAVMDEGNGIKEIPPVPNIERIIDKLDPPTGFGLLLMNKLADQVDFSIKADGGHIVEMIIRIAR